MIEETNNVQEKHLEKKLLPINVWALAFGCIIGWGAFVMPGNTFLINAGPLGTIIAMMIAMVIMIIIANNYYYMINVYPMSGGEVVYTKNAFGKVHGFICAWFLSLSYLSIVPLNATALALVGRSFFSSFFQIGFHYEVANYDVYLGEVLLAVAVLVIIAYISIRGVKIVGWIQTALTVILIMGVLLVSLAALLNPTIKFENLLPLYYPDKNVVSGIFAVVAVAPWAFVGFDTVPQAVEEFHFSRRKSKAILVLSIVFGGIVYIALNTVTAAVIPKEYETWVEYINISGQLEGIKALPTFYAAYELLGNIGLFFLGFSVLAAILSGIMGFYMATSRLLYAMAMEKILPTFFGRLHTKYKTPDRAILFILLVSIVAPFMGRTALGWIVDMSSVGAAIGYGYTSAAAARYAWKNGNKGTVITGIMGVIFAVIFGVLLLIPIPGLSCMLGKESYVALLLWIVIGGAFFIIAKDKKNRED